MKKKVELKKKIIYNVIEKTERKIQMKYKKELGISIINFILIVLIIAFCGIIFYLVIPTQYTDIVENIKNVTEIIEANYTVQNTSAEQTTPEVKLSDSILYGDDTKTSTPITQESNVKYYYQQLGDDGKTIYNKIERNINSLKNGYGDIVIGELKYEIGDKFQGAWDAFSLDHPEIFYVETDNISLLTKTTTFLGSSKYEYIIQPKEGQTYFSKAWNSKAQVENATEEIEEKARYIIEQTSLYNSRYEKIKYVHDYLIDNMEYDKQDGENRSNIYGALVDQKAICEGYADTFKYLMDKLQIPCVIVCGDAIGDNSDTEFHAWNYVQMENGSWYAVDVTWDDPIIIGSGSVSNDIKYRYFLVGSNSFSGSHVEDGDVSGTGQNFKYPQISTDDY